MPLSEEELRLLEQMEQALAQEDPKFVSTLRGSTLERAVRMRAVTAGAAFAVGIAMLMAGAVAQMTWLGILGFVVMLASATIGLASWHGRHAPTQSHPTDALFDFDDHPQRFDVIDGGKSGKSGKSGRSSRTGKARRLRRPGRSAGPARGAGKQGTFIQRMEQRWERRRNQGY